MNIAPVAPKMAQIQLTKQSGNMQAFGQVFGQMLTNPATESHTAQASGMEDLLALLNLTSLEELEEMVEGPVSLDKLEALLKDLVGEESVEDETDIWGFIEGMLLQNPALKESIIAAVQSGQQKDLAIQLAGQLKMVEMIGKNSDLTLKQESLIFDIGQLLGSIKEGMSGLGKTEGVQAIKAMNSNLHFMKILNEPIQMDSAIEAKETISGQGQLPNLTQPKVETGTIVLPFNKSGQSEELAKELQKIMNKVQFGQTGGANRLVVKLYPEQLGTVRIELIQKDGMLTAKMLASTPLGKELLDTNASQLRNGLLSQNIQVEKLEVSMALQDTARQDRQQNFDGSFRQQQQTQEQEKQDNEEEVALSFQELLEGLEV